MSIIIYPKFENVRNINKAEPCELWHVRESYNPSNPRTNNFKYESRLLLYLENETKDTSSLIAIFIYEIKHVNFFPVFVWDSLFGFSVMLMPIVPGISQY